MKLTKVVKQGSLSLTVALGLTVLAPVSAEVAYAKTADTNAAAQELINSLEALDIGEVDYLYSYLQSINLSTDELNKINANTQRAQQILSNTTLTDLSNAEKVEVTRLFNENVKLAHLQAAIVDDNGNKINVLEHEIGTTGLNVQLLDPKGNVLATVVPDGDDLDPAVISSKISAFKDAVDAKVVLDKEDKFVPMPEAKLPKTATDNPTYILIGGLLALTGAVALLPAARLARKMD